MDFIFYNGYFHFLPFKKELFIPDIRERNREKREREREITGWISAIQLTEK